MNALHANSYYAASVDLGPSLPALEGILQADVCVIGGGLTGINTALELASRGMSVVLLEAGRLGWAASGRNGGQLIRGLGHEVESFGKWVGEEGVRFLHQAGFDSVEIVRQRITEHQIECDLRWGYCDLANKASHWKNLQAEKQQLEMLGYRHELRLVPQSDIHQVVASESYKGALVDMGSGHLHPLKLLLGEAQIAIAKGVQIYEHSRVVRLVHGKQVEVHTETGCVKAGSVVLACDALLGKLEPRLSSKVISAGSYVITTAPLRESQARALLPLNTAMCDQQVTVDYYRRTVDNRLLFGGACHYSGRDPADIKSYMRRKMEKVFPQLNGVAIDYAWSGLIGIGANRFPQIGRLENERNIFYSQGYSGHGLNVTHFAAKILADAISLQDGSGVELFEKVPHRHFPGGEMLRSPLLALGMLWYRIKDFV
ncbi:MAG: FAD-binding oxidoreductase [Pseudomonas caspiana]